MVILGIGDGVDAGAALVVDARLVAVELQARHDQAARSRAFPWGAVEAVLHEAGLRERDVDQVAVAGRFTPPLVVRKHPRLRKVARDAFSPAHEAQVYYQAILKQSGLGAMDADRAEEWFAQRFASRGFSPQRVETIDIHTALANAAYRGQPEDNVLVVTLHPMGDGAVCKVHRGRAGQIDRIWEQRGFSSLHVHLQRCAAAMGFQPLLDDARMWSLAARGTPDPALVELLQQELSVDGPHLARTSARPAGRDSAVYSALAKAPRDVAAASVLENLTRSVCGLVAAHVQRTGIDVVAVGGALFDNPRLCAAVAELPEVRRLWVGPEPGWSSLSMGAAMAVAGMHNQLLQPPGLGGRVREASARAALAAGGMAGRSDPQPGDLAAVLARGGAVARFVGRGGFGSHGAGSRSVLVRADDPVAVGRAMQALALPPEHEPVAAVGVGEPGIEGLEALPAALYGAVALRVDAAFAERYPGVVTPDRRVHLLEVAAERTPGLHAVVEALRAQTGCGALAVLPLAQGQDPVVAWPSDAVRVFRRAGLDALQLGPWLVEGAGDRA